MERNRTGDVSADPSWEQVRAALDELEDDGEAFVILSSAAQQYLQTVMTGEFYHVEWRDGSERRHFATDAPVSRRILEDTFSAFYHGSRERLSALFSPDG
jgi:hypothetical protein